jgi:predicted O-methyltransferase YrrM
MQFQIKSYFKFLWKSKNEYSVHSPFVFDLLVKCFYDRKPYPEYQVLENYRKSLLENKTSIEVTDFGAGSKVFKSNKREIAQIAKTAGISARRAELLFRVTNYFKPENILEIGTSLGLATSALSLGNPLAKITTLEGCPQTSDVAKMQLKKFEMNNVKVVITEFESFLQSDHLKSQICNLVYFDGNHQKDPTLNYFELLLSTATNDSVWIFDDIHWSADMEQAWETIKKHPKVTATIDTFQWGFVFFRKEQLREHFILRA